jgi:UDP-glucose-4-epimerase GalE
MKQTILVTGGTGFIGSHTTVELQQAGYDVVIVDDLSNSNINVVDGIEKITGIRPAFEQVDLRDMAATEAVFQKYPRIEGIIHFAASKAVGESVEKPLLYYRNNIISLVNLLELMPKYDVKGIIFSSSCTVYGQPKPENLPVTEEAPHQKATSPYGNTKEINEQIIYDYIHSGAPIKSIVLRYFNPIGAHPSALIGELPNGVPNNLIPFVTQTAMGIRKELTIFGNDYDTPDGTASAITSMSSTLPGPCGSHGTRAGRERREDRLLQHRYRQWQLYARDCRDLREGYGGEAQLEIRPTPRGRHREDLGRRHQGQYRAGLEGRGLARRCAALGLEVAGAVAREQHHVSLPSEYSPRSNPL